MGKIKPVLTADCRGMCCPLPAVMLKRNLAKIDVGDILELIATDPDTEWDIPATSENIGAQLVKREKRGLNFVYYLKRMR